MLILGIESSCDDAAAAVIETCRAGEARVRSSAVANQDLIPRPLWRHRAQLASRNHVVTILPVMWQALRPPDAGLATWTESP